MRLESLSPISLVQFYLATQYTKMEKTPLTYSTNQQENKYKSFLMINKSGSTNRTNEEEQRGQEKSFGTDQDSL